jgi:hypothetical protein
VVFAWRSAPRPAIYPIYLWAWERPENLASADPKQFAVAYLAETIRMTATETLVLPRHQPLSVADGATMLPVIRIETRPGITDLAAREGAVVAAIDEILKKQSAEQLQLDFDATVGERDFYRAVVIRLRQSHPHLRLSITALASWCLHDRWIHDLPIDEAVPMLFRMGADARSVRETLNDGQDFAEPLCRQSYGVSLDEAIPRLRRERRLYLFSPHSWSSEDLVRVARESE